MDIYEYEKELIKSEGIDGIYCGVDEAGRGPLAGPVCAAAVILKPGVRIEGLGDSKKISEKKRNELFDIIIDSSISYGIAFSSAQEIEDMGILPATFDAMNRAIKQLSETPELSLIDGNLNYGIKYPSMPVIKGDDKCASIAAASILAKVSRDRFMIELDEKYPLYSFGKHKGYGSKLHFQMIDEHGLCPEHRESFLKKHFAKKNAPEKTVGNLGEEWAGNFLREKGFDVIGKNYRSEYGEIDIIARDDEFLVFAEVKLRKSDKFAKAAEHVTVSKREKIKTTAALWLEENENHLQPRFDVIEIYAPKGKETRLLKINHIENAFY